MTLTETVKSFLTTGTKQKELSSEVDLRQVKISAEDEYYPFAGGVARYCYNLFSHFNNDKCSGCIRQESLFNPRTDMFSSR